MQRRVERLQNQAECSAAIERNMTDQPVWRNPVHARLEAGLPAFALTITTSSVEAAAHAATLGFHFLWIEMEHFPITLETLRLMVLAGRGLPAAVFARIPVVELWTANAVTQQLLRFGRPADNDDLRGGRGIDARTCHKQSTR
jgi:hypothetical protein